MANKYSRGAMEALELVLLSIALASAGCGNRDLRRSPKESFNRIRVAENGDLRRSPEKSFERIRVAETCFNYYTRNCESIGGFSVLGPYVIFPRGYERLAEQCRKYPNKK